MATITRNTNGDVDIVDVNLKQYNLPSGTVGIAQDAYYADTALITSEKLPGGKLSIKRTDLTTINGSAPPATLALLITLLGDTVFQSAGGGAGGVISGSVTINDPITPSNKVSVLQFHNIDNQQIGGGFAINTGGVAQILNPAGNLDRQRETGVDSIPALGISTGAAQNAQPFNTTHAGATIVGASIVFTPVAMAGFTAGSPWSIQVGSILTLEPTPTNGPVPANTEVVVVVSVTATTFTAKAAKTHTAGFTLNGFVYNQSRDATLPDGSPGQGVPATGTYLANKILNGGAGGWEQERSAAGELDGATGQGTAVAAEYEYNGGGPGGGNFDRARNLQGKLLNASTVASGGTLGVNTLVVAAIPGLQAGEMVLIDRNTANAECLYMTAGWTGTTTLTFTSVTLFTHANGATIEWDDFGAMGPKLNGFTAFGIGIEEEALYNPLDGLYYIERSATADSMPAANIVAENPALWNGATMDRQRGNIDTTALVTLAASAVSGTSADQVNVNGRGVQVIIDITAITGTVPIITVIIQGKDLASGKYYPLLTSAALSTVSTNQLSLYPGNTVTANISASQPLPRVWRLSYTIAGTTPAVTATIGASVIV